MTAITDKITLYMIAEESSIERRGKTFLIKTGDEEKGQRIPSMKVKDIVIIGGLTLDSRVIDLCRDDSIPIHFFNGKWDYQGTLQFEPVKNLFIRRAQIFKHFDTEIKLNIAKKIVYGKIKNQQSFLDKFRLNLPIEYPEASTVDNMETLRGIEGYSTKQYYGYFSSLVKNSDFSFTGRTKRPPEDEINALLSLTYTFLFNEIQLPCWLV